MVYLSTLFREIVFNAVWEELAKEGLVDAIFSAEYNREYREWVKKGRPIDPIVLQTGEGVPPEGITLEGPLFTQPFIIVMPAVELNGSPPDEPEGGTLII